MLAADGAGVAFTGPADIETGDPKALAAWVEGRAAPAQSELRPLQVRGDVTMSNEKLAITRLTAEFERKPLSGRLLYAFAAGNRPARLEAELAAPELDIDAALAFGKALLAGSNLQRPQDMAIKADIGRASFAGIDARNASAQIESGRRRTADRSPLGRRPWRQRPVGERTHRHRRAHGPHGSLALDLDLKQPAAVAALAAQFIPASAAASGARPHRPREIARHARRHRRTGCRRRASRSPAMSTPCISTPSLRLRGDWSRRSIADVRIEGTLDAPEGAALFKLIGLDRIAAAGRGPGRLTLQIAGPAAGQAQRLVASVRRRVWQ